MFPAVPTKTVWSIRNTVFVTKALLMVPDAQCWQAHPADWALSLMQDRALQGLALSLHWRPHSSSNYPAQVPHSMQVDYPSPKPTLYTMLSLLMQYRSVLQKARDCRKLSQRIGTKASRGRIWCCTVNHFTPWKLTGVILCNNGFSPINLKLI